MKWIKRFLLIIQFLTRIPVNIQIEIEEDDFGKGVVFFPLVGLIIGAVSGSIYYVFSRFSYGLVPIIFSMLSGVLITGALHIDGLADTCDGIFSARNKERMLEIMRDSRIGTNGAIAIIFDFMLRIAILNLFNEKQALLAILVAPIVSRTLTAIIIYTSTYARAEGGLGKLFIGKVSLGVASLAVAIGLVLTYISLGFYGLIAFILSLIVVIIFRAHVYSKIGGITGDVLGAANEISEISFIMFLLLVWTIL